ncbi:MAG: hypothetical protein COT32_01525 [Candidatus Nealsonbacteria bacterium CG08_land_8_20_14_0_20_36_22]|uniref:Uncharacterized protein n=1 Tax=Candidatus Nealsonbacteria bacterium CG08_land_8_20_14_0_20_36_22 TaxID=1974704 RepID=A0A2H0YNV6_9BACT|nr:MAG: hypothetical protein COT32_01525 [Candidatus Nealsonbacteria bacterium CG08_land_8_20_14_0_20_36_22]
MNNAQRLKILAGSGKTVFSLKNLQSLWEVKNQTTKMIAKRMTDKGLIFRISKGYYSLSKDFNDYELANLIISPSYISLHSSFFYHKVSFQLSNTITSVALFNYQKKVKEKVFKYYAMKKNLFFNLEGINYKDNLSIACPERAILDSFYFGLLPNMDNPENINGTYLKEISFYYPKEVNKKIRRLLKKLSS